jgi:outer membrane immunogenic protein
MKKLLMTIAALAVFGGKPVLAADMAVKAPPQPAACVWCGWYAGFNAGWVGFSGSTINNTGTDTGPGGLGSALAVGFIPSSVGVGPEGFLGGVQVGFNWQNGNWVYGLEADFDGSSARKTASFAVNIPPFAPITSQFGLGVDWFSTVRGRLGVTIAPSLLAYVTGGVAIADLQLSNTFICATCGPPSNTESTTANSNKTVSVGGTVGGGMEWMIAPHVSLKAEYLFADLGTTRSAIFYTYIGGSSSLTSSVHNKLNIGRAGLNWHF